MITAVEKVACLSDDNQFLFGRQNLLANDLTLLLKEAEFIAIEKLRFAPNHKATTQIAKVILANELGKHLEQNEHQIDILHTDSQNLKDKINELLG